MINWQAVRADDIIILAQIAASHGWGISDLLRNLDLLSEEERETVQRILDVHIAK